MGEQVLGVVRSGRKVLSGTMPQLVALAKEGKLEPGDRLEGLDRSGLLDVHAVPELARLVPTAEERRTSRSLQMLIVFDVVFGGPLALRLGEDLLARRRPGELREQLLTALFYVALFVVPIVPLRWQLAKLKAGREAGHVNGVVPEPTPGDEALRARLARPVRATWVLLATLVLPFAISAVLPPLWLEQHFAKINDRVRAGEVWRLVTAMFVHAGIIHLLFNSLALAEFGKRVENLYGRLRLVVVYFSAGVVGFALSCLTTSSASVGASGGIFGLVGVLFVVGLRHRRVWPAVTRNRLVVEMALCIGLNVAYGLLSPFIDNAAHLGGLLVGLACGWWLELEPDLQAELGTQR